MKTDDLIAALAADRGTAAPAFSRTLMAAVIVALVAAAMSFMVGLGPRTDLATAAVTPRFIFKVLVTLAVVAAALPLLWRLGRPDALITGRRWPLAAAPLLLAAGVLVELLTVPASEWGQTAIGTNAVLCLTAIPLLAVLPLAALLFAMRRGATTTPSFTGAMAGLLSSGIAAAFYAFHCFDDSPLFVMIWYSLGIGVVTLVAAVLGQRLLRW